MSSDLAANRRVITSKSSNKVHKNIPQLKVFSAIDSLIFIKIVDGSEKLQKIVHTS